MTVRKILFVAAVATLLPAAVPAAPYPGDYNICLGTRGVDEAIDACTRLINSRRLEERPFYFAPLYYARGVAWHAKGETDRAIADYDEAIRLNPRDARSYLQRGVIWHAKGEPDRALADYDEAIRLNPRNYRAYLGRGGAWIIKGEHDRAIADYNEAIRLNWLNAGAYRNRGLAHLYAGAAAKALADLSQAAVLEPEDAYIAIWVDIAGHRDKAPSRLADAIKTIDMTKWPGPVIRLLLGESALAIVLAAADDPDPKKKNEQMCAAHFYGGEWASRQGDKQEALRLYRLAAQDCARTLLERNFANAE